MVIGLLHASLSIPESRSLKDKRSALQSLKDRLRNEMNISVAEMGKQDLWNAAELAFVTVANEKLVVEQRLSAVTERLRSNPRVVLLDVHTELF